MSKQHLEELYSELQFLLEGFDLPESKRAKIQEYRQLSKLERLSDYHANRIAEIWEDAIDDEALSAGLELVDELENSILDEDNLLADDKDLRSHLSEHISVLVQAKQKDNDTLPKQLRIDSPHKSGLVMLCPDGSGFITVSLGDGELIDFQQICRQCHIPLSEHGKPVFVAGISSSS